ncbi:MAG: dptF [Firmicutes bacterium]|nr:dptF [Bacillota bacterium]
MGVCDFVDILNRLRKSSRDSIDNVEIFDSFKKYMHVTRRMEEDLKEIIKNVTASNEKNLILVCGSAGDGKSHLLSYLKNEECLLDNFHVINDATESGSPSKTAIDTLNDLLDEFSDAKINKPGRNIILAINLGVLSNFIESEYGERYSKLQSYVRNCNILTSKIDDNSYKSESRFQHVNFADYHMYTLIKNGINSEYMLDILEKVFSEDESNIFFYQEYLRTCRSCPLVQKCPVKSNYEFLHDINNRKYVAELLVKEIIQDKEILTTREFLNFIYDILVSPKFSYQAFINLTNDAAYLKLYISCITPVLLFESNDVSRVLNNIRKYDPLLVRSEEDDEQAIEYYVTADIKEYVLKTVKATAYEKILGQDSNLDIINTDNFLKTKMFNILVRLNYIKTKIDDKFYLEYIKTLYNYNVGRVHKLQTIYEKVEHAVRQWCGSESDQNVCLDNQWYKCSLYAKVEFSAFLENLPDSNENELQRFFPEIVTEFRDPRNPEQPISLHIDYSLFKLISKLNMGYVQTSKDRNNHADFISFIGKMLKTGSSNYEVTVIGHNGVKAVVQKTGFGYKFRVVE